MNALTTLASLVEKVRTAAPAEHSLFLQLGDCRIEVRCSTTELQDELVRYFGCFLAEPGPCPILVTAHETPAPDLPFPLEEKEPDPGKSKVKEAFADIPGGRVVRKKLTGMVFLFGPGINVAAGPCLANPNQVVNFINNRHIEYALNQGCLLGHAAAVAREGEGLCLAGFSGAGKSTLSLELMSRGMTFVSNDRIMVEQRENGLRMHGVAKHPRINPGTVLNNQDLIRILDPEDLDRFSVLPPEKLWTLEHKFDALIEECFGPNRFVLSSDMLGLVILNWKRDGGSTHARLVDPKQRHDLLQAFIKSPGLFYLPSSAQKLKPSTEDYAELLSHAALIEIHGGVDFDLAAKICLHFLETGDVL